MSAERRGSAQGQLGEEEDLRPTTNTSYAISRSRLHDVMQRMLPPAKAWTKGDISCELQEREERRTTQPQRR